jgi:hypothetical protein
MEKTLWDEGDWPSPDERAIDLKCQHEAWLRQGYDGHNRKPLKVSRRARRWRHWRRLSNWRCRQMTKWFGDWTPPRWGPPVAWA